MSLSDYWDDKCPVRGFYLKLGFGDTGSAVAVILNAIVLVGAFIGWWTLGVVVLIATGVITVVGTEWRKKQAKKRRKGQ